MKTVSFATSTAAALMMLAMHAAPTALVMVVDAQNVIERRPCMQPDNPNVEDSRKRTTGTCSSLSCNSGCCRYHTAFLTCDTENRFPHQACVCNANTAPPPGRSPPSTPGNSPGIPVNPGGGSNSTPVTRPPVPAPVSPPPTTPAPTPTPAPSSSMSPEAFVESSTNPPVVPITACSGGSVWQTLGLPFENCATNADCQDVMDPTNPSRPTCCKKSFCWCGVYDVEAAECIA